MTRASPERDLHLWTANLLKAAARPGVVFFHPKNEGKRTPRDGAFQKRMGMLPGVADFIFCVPNGRFAALELKAPKGRLSETQREFRDAVFHAGGGYAVADSTTAVETILRHWNVIRPLSHETNNADSKNGFHDAGAK